MIRTTLMFQPTHRLETQKTISQMKRSWEAYQAGFSVQFASVTLPREQAFVVIAGSASEPGATPATSLAQCPDAEGLISTTEISSDTFATSMEDKKCQRSCEITEGMSISHKTIIAVAVGFECSSNMKILVNFMAGSNYLYLSFLFIELGINSSN
jgi:hypothetical protein